MKTRSSFLPGLISSLSGRLLLLTMGFVILAEILVFVPSVARFRETYLGERLEAAYLAAMSIAYTGELAVERPLEEDLLSSVGAYSIALRRPGREDLVLERDTVPPADEEHDLYEDGVFALIGDALDTLFFGGDQTLRIMGMVRGRPNDVVELTLDDTQLRAEMIDYSGRILALSLVISLITAGLVYLALLMMFVRPMRRITDCMITFAEDPEDSDNVIQPSARRDEIGVVERQLAEMQGQIRGALKQKKRLADLGSAVTKINHDLRNSLASAYLMSDRLASSADPQVKRITPNLIRAIDRAIDLCTQTLKYGKAEEAPPRRVRFELKPLVEDVVSNVGLPPDQRIDWHVEMDADLQLYADPEQLYRILLNLGRNAVQAIDGAGQGSGRIRVTATDRGDHVSIEMIDNGPGLPESARAHLFEPFSGSAREGGTGLGLAIVQELVRAHRGRVKHYEPEGGGAAFEIILPNTSEKGERAA